jgi:flagellar protein FliL
MSTEMRTMSSTATKPGAKPAGGEGADSAAEGAGKGGKGGKGGRKKLLLLVVLVLVVGGAAAWWFLFRGGSADAATKAAPKPVPGTVLTVDPISINLADGHYLKLGFALQQTADAKEAVDGSQALDTAISLYSGKTMAQLSDPASRDALKKELVAEVSKEYEDEVYDVYFTEYVMQ